LNNSLGEGFKSFWHAMTSNDRHANHDSPQRSFTGNRPLSVGVGRNPPLNSVISPSGVNLNRPYHEDDANRSTTALHNGNGYSPRLSTNGAPSPNMPYSPGMRTSTIQASGDGGIALQEFGTDGMPPAPPVSHSWGRIEAWAEENYPELFDQLCTPATVNDVNELEFSLDCTLPMEVRDSLQIHDGQERGGRPTGAIFGGMLMDCEEILDEWKNWRVVESEFLQNPAGPGKGGSDEAGPSSAVPLSRTDLQAKQGSQPDGAVQKVYAHAGWIPLVRDWGGNYIAVDLAPGPNGTWGQIILTGRDYDIKYVVSRSWAHFLAMVADDMQSPHWYVDEDSGDLKLKDPRAPRSEPSYIEILRVRNERKYGKRRFSQRPASMAGSRPGSRPNSMPGSPHLSAAAKGGLTRPPKQSDTMDDNHLKPPSKKSMKPLRSVSEESTAPAAPAVTATSKGTAGGDLLNEAMEEIKIDDDKKEDGVAPLKRSSSDLMVPSPSTTPKPNGIDV
jgi:cell wall assembly regulator SMI1